MSAWTENAVWWHVYPLGALGADTTGTDRTARRTLRDLEPWLDHLVRLGANGLALGPVFASQSHGYDTTDHLALDERLGDEADLDHLLAAARDRGVRVTLDGVFNHVGRGFDRFLTAERDPSSPEAAWFSRDADGRLQTFEGHDALVALDHTSPEVERYVVEVMNHWLDRGVDGWRLDAAYATPASFWARVLPQVRVEHPGAFLFGEVLHGDYADFVRDSTLDAVTQYELWKAVWSSLSDANFFELDWTLQRHGALLDTFVPVTFLGNHDVTRIASQIGEERHHAHALVVLLTVAGSPAIYYGDDWGLRGVKEERIGGDNAVRPELPADPTNLEPGTESVRALHQELVGLRRRHPWLHRARTRSLLLTNTTYVYETAADGERLVVALNLGEHPLVATTDATDVRAGHADSSGDSWTVPPHGWVVLG